MAEPRILDHRGEPIRRNVLTDEIAGPTITGVRSIWSGQHIRDLTPARLAAILRESEVPGDGAAESYLALAELMEERDLHYLGCLQTRKRQVGQIDVTIEPTSDAAEDVRDADLAREAVERAVGEDERIDLLDAIGKSYSVAEIIWETSERQWMPRRLEWRLPQWFDFDRMSGRRLQRRGDDGAWVPLEPWKFVTHIVQAKAGLPIRGGLARIAAWSWMFKSYTLRDWVRFVEAYGQPLRLGKYDKASTPDDKAVLFKAVRQIGADMAAIVPEEMSIEFPGWTSVQGRSDLYKSMVGYIDAQISIAVLGQTLTTQPGDSGSYALGAVHNLVREDIERSDGRQLAETLRRDLVIPVVTLNHGPRRRYPTVSIRRVASPDLKLLAEALAKLVPLGLRVRSDQVRTWFDLEAPATDDEVLAAPPAPPDITQLRTRLGAPELAIVESALALARAGAGDAARHHCRCRWSACGATPCGTPTASSTASATASGRAGTSNDAMRALVAMHRGRSQDAFAATIGEALMAAELAGRYDVLDPEHAGPQG